MSEKAYDQSGPYMPQSDSGFRDWLLNLSSRIALDPFKYGLQPSDATLLTTIFNDYDQLYQLCQQSVTRTSTNIAAKDSVKASAMATCRTYAMQLKANAGLDNSLKLELGIHINNPPTPIPAPTTRPMLSIVAGGVGEHVLEYADEMTPTSRKRPYGAAQMELYVHVGPQATTNPNDAEYAGVHTRCPFIHTFQPEQAGLTASYFARWRTERGLVGPFSLPVAMMIAFGGPVDQPTPEMFYPGAPGGGQPKLTDETDGEDGMRIAA